MVEGTEARRQAFAEAVYVALDGRLKDGVELHKEGGAKYGFHLRGPGWGSKHNGFAVLPSCRPCLIVLRTARISLPEGRYEVAPNNGPVEADRPMHCNIEFADQDAGTGTPSPEFIGRLLAIIESAAIR